MSAARACRRAATGSVPPGIQRLPHNKGIECLDFVPRRPASCAHADRAFRARSRRGRNIQGFLQAGSAWSEFSVKRIGDFDLTDCALTPKGDLLVLERSFSRFKGVAMRIRRVMLTGIQPGATVDGPVLIEADMGYQIDNMEAFRCIVRDGALVLTLISDDNFSMIQRTLLLQFTLEEP